MMDYIRENFTALIFGAIIVAVMICAAGAGAYIFFNTDDINEILQDSPFGNACTQPEAFEQRAQIKLPASASDLEPLCGGIGAQAVQGTFNMNPGDLNRFMENAGLELPYSQTEYPEDDTFRFFPEKATVQSWLYQVHDDPLLFKQILIDTSNPSEYRVYINGLTG